jgi:hypothetical protein
VTSTRDDRIDDETRCSGLSRSGPAANAARFSKRDISVDGHSGPQTTTALPRFQELAGLKITGLVDDETWKALLSVNENTAQEIAELRDVLTTVATKNNYQCARYDGRLARVRG